MTLAAPSLLTLGLALAFATSCSAPSPLSRSYDDPWNTPLPNEVAPTSYTPAEEDCIRTNSAGCDGLCASDSDCDEDDACFEGRCIPRSELSPR